MPKQPYQLPLLPIDFDSETELAFYRRVGPATAKLGQLREKLRYSIVNRSFLELLTLFESVESTRIEGTQVTFSDMLEDELEQSDEWRIIETRNYQDALQLGIEQIQNGYPLTERLVRRLHEELMKDARGAQGAAGNYRQIQNFIGPTNDIRDATYIPPEAQRLPDYMSNLELFINGHPYKEVPDDELHPLIKCAIIHAQFESIHPFLDGNGRLGRILIILYLLQSKLIDSPFFFLSEELEKEKFRYYALLNGVRGIGKPEPDWKSWILFFLDATLRMAERLYEKLDRAERLYHAGLGQIQKESTKTIWGALFNFPITHAPQLSKYTGLAPSTVRNSLNELEHLRLIFGDDRKRNKRYYFYDLTEIIQR